MRPVVGLFLVGSMLLGCGGPGLASLRPRAAFDLACPAAQLELVSFEGHSAGAVGCGRRASFRQVCGAGPWGARVNCAWVLASPVQSDSPGYPPSGYPPQGYPPGTYQTPTTRWETRGTPIAPPRDNTQRR